jgi:hypothetical protein
MIVPSTMSQKVANGVVADPEREVACLAPHRHDDVPAPRRPGVLHEVLDELDADVARRLEPEGRDVRGER